MKLCSWVSSCYISYQTAICQLPEWCECTVHFTTHKFLPPLVNCHSLLALYPGLLTPAFVTHSTNAGEGLIKLSHMQWRTWTYRRVAHSQKNHKELSALPIANTDCRTTERLTSDSSGNITWVQKATLQLYRRNVPLLHTWFSFIRPSAALVLQATMLGWEGLGTRLHITSLTSLSWWEGHAFIHHNLQEAWWKVRETMNLKNKTILWW